jgi:hypothetical protein
MIAAVVNFIVWILVLGALYWLVIYVIDTIPVPEPANRIAKLVLTVLVSLAMILMLLQLVGVPTGVTLPGLL